MENKKICSACNTENREDFQFCKQCGAKLPQIVNAEPDDTLQKDFEATTPQAEAPDFSAPETNANMPSELDELAAFIGPNGYEIAQKQLNMKERFKKAGWNWPVFLFGFLLSLPFVWFYYRKMYKQGTAVLLATLALMLSISGCVAGFLSPVFEATGVLLNTSAYEDYGSAYVGYTPADNDSLLDNEFNRQFEDGFRKGFTGNIPDSVMDEMIAKLTSKLPQMLICFFAIGLLSISYLVFVILLSVYADNIYRNHCEKKIMNIKSTENCNLLVLQNVGGTSTLAAVLTGIFFCVGMSIISSIIIFAGMAPLFSAIVL